MPRHPLIRPWTDADDAKLLALHRQGKQPVVIAARMQRSVGAVYTRRKVLLAAATGDHPQAPAQRALERT